MEIYLDYNATTPIEKEVANAIRPDTILISVMLANNEVGTIQPPQSGFLQEKILQKRKSIGQLR